MKTVSCSPSQVHYTELPPANSLAPFVECIWMLQSDSNLFNNRELIIPGGRTEMIFNFGNPIHWIDSKDTSLIQTCYGSYFLGPRNRPFFIEQRGIINMVGVRFRHGGLAPFTTVPMNLLLNEVVPMDHLFGNEGDILTHRLHTLDKATQKILIEDFLMKRFQHLTCMRQTLHLISQVKQCAFGDHIKKISEKSGVHYKKMERIFSKYTGYNPKNFSRVIRFYSALQHMKKSSSSLTGIGLNNGYYDQPHFIRDFKAFTGKSPSQFHTENHTIANLLLQSQHV